MSTSSTYGSSTISISPKKRHLIYSYYMENTGILEVFRTIIKSYYVTDDLLKLNQQDDSQLIQLIQETAEYGYPMPNSKITFELDPEALRYNAYHRLFGYVIKGKENFPRSPSFNSQYHRLFDGIMINIAHGILDQQITIEKLANPASLSKMLTDMREMLINHTFNTIEYEGNYWALAFDRMRALLRNNPLMQNRLNVRSYGDDRRLIELGEKLKVPVSKQTLYLFTLAERMEVFLLNVEKTVWDSNKAENLYSSVLNFKEIFGAYYQVSGTDYMQLALAVRRRALPPQIASSP